MSDLFEVLILLYFALLNGTYGVLIVLAVFEVYARMASRLPEFDAATLSDPRTPPITIIAPAFNEEAVIVDSVRACQQLDYPNLEIVVVNDGSTDRTLEVLKERFQLKALNLIVRPEIETRPITAIYQSARDERLKVVDKANGGKADALNAGLNASRTPLVCCIDTDTLIDRRALLRMVEPFLYEDRRVIATGGTVRVANGCTVKEGVVQRVDLPRSWLARFQMVEYLRAFLFGRLGYNRLGGNLIVSGAFGLFLREAVVEAGGYLHDTVGEDIELIVRMHRTEIENGRDYKIGFIPDPVCYTEAPETFAQLGRQRERWHRGLAHTLWLHRAVILNPDYGRIGMLVMPIYAFFEFLGPVIELVGYGWFLYRLAEGALDARFIVLFFVLAFLLSFLLSLQSLLLDYVSFDVYRGVRLRSGLILAALLENLGFRQLTLVYRVRGLFRFLRGERRWGEMPRKGFAAERR